MTYTHNWPVTFVPLLWSCISFTQVLFMSIDRNVDQDYILYFLPCFDKKKSCVNWPNYVLFWSCFLFTDIARVKYKLDVYHRINSRQLIQYNSKLPTIKFSSIFLKQIAKKMCYCYNPTRHSKVYVLFCTFEYCNFIMDIFQ